MKIQENYRRFQLGNISMNTSLFDILKRIEI